MLELVLSLGANCGDRDKALRDAVDWLSRQMAIISQSEIYETPCANGQDKKYLNMVLTGLFEGDLTAFDKELKKYEKSAGRDTACRSRGDVPVDLDIVIADNKIIKEWDYRQKFFRLGYESIIKNGR